MMLNVGVTRLRQRRVELYVGQVFRETTSNFSTTFLSFHVMRIVGGFDTLDEVIMRSACIDNAYEVCVLSVRELVLQIGFIRKAC